MRLQQEGYYVSIASLLTYLHSTK